MDWIRFQLASENNGGSKFRFRRDADSMMETSTFAETHTHNFTIPIMQIAVLAASAAAATVVFWTCFAVCICLCCKKKKKKMKLTDSMHRPAGAPDEDADAVDAGGSHLASRPPPEEERRPSEDRGGAEAPVHRRKERKAGRSMAAGRPAKQSTSYVTLEQRSAQPSDDRQSEFSEHRDLYSISRTSMDATQDFVKDQRKTEGYQEITVRPDGAAKVKTTPRQPPPAPSPALTTARDYEPLMMSKPTEMSSEKEVTSTSTPTTATVKKNKKKTKQMSRKKMGHQSKILVTDFTKRKAAASMAGKRRHR